MDFNNFFAVERFYQLTIYRLSEEITTFNGQFGDAKNNHLG